MYENKMDERNEMDENKMDERNEMVGRFSINKRKH